MIAMTTTVQHSLEKHDGNDADSRDEEDNGTATLNPKPYHHKTDVCVMWLESHSQSLHSGSPQ